MLNTKSTLLRLMTTRSQGIGSASVKSTEGKPLKCLVAIVWWFRIGKEPQAKDNIRRTSHARNEHINLALFFKKEKKT